MTESENAAKAQIRQGLAEIESAQDSLRRASELLCPITGFAREWEATGKLYLSVKQHWHRDH